MSLTLKLRSFRLEMLEPTFFLLLRMSWVSCLQPVMLVSLLFLFSARILVASNSSFRSNIHGDVLIWARSSFAADEDRDRGTLIEEHVYMCSGAQMVPISWQEMQCPVTFQKEFRKVAKVVVQG